jgi:hypothetical protein
MPYKDPERKRRWEQEHREERNARRRKFSSGNSPGPSSIGAKQSDSNSAQLTLNSMSVATVVMMGLASLLTMLFLIRRLGSSANPLQVPGLESPDLPQERF